MFKVGDLVRVKESSAKRGANRRWVHNHGWLWVVTGVRLNGHDGRKGIYTKSLATGAEEDDKREIFWYADELEKADV